MMVESPHLKNVIIKSLLKNLLKYQKIEYSFIFPVFEHVWSKKTGKTFLLEKQNCKGGKKTSGNLYSCLDNQSVTKQRVLYANGTL